MAIIFMSKLESEALALSPRKPRLYRRYIDDCLLIWLHGMMLLLEFLNFMNSRHPDIRFTIEHTEQNEEHMVSYLDLSISVSNGILAWELYIKPSHSGVHFSYDTAIPYEVKRSVAIEQFRRARRNASMEEGRGMQKIIKLLAENGYPTSIVESTREQ